MEPLLYQQIRVSDSLTYQRQNAWTDSDIYIFIFPLDGFKQNRGRIYMSGTSCDFCENKRRSWKHTAKPKTPVSFWGYRSCGFDYIFFLPFFFFLVKLWWEIPHNLFKHIWNNSQRNIFWLWLQPLVSSLWTEESKRKIWVVVCTILRLYLSKNELRDDLRICFTKLFGVDYRRYNYLSFDLDLHKVSTNLRPVLRTTIHCEIAANKLKDNARFRSSEGSSISIQYPLEIHWSVQ